MINTEKIYVETPRGRIRINETFETDEEARERGYGLWFSHNGVAIYGHTDPCLKATVKHPENY